MPADNFIWFPQAATGGLVSSGKTSAAQPKGESQDAFFSKKGAVEISEFSFGVSQTESASSGTGGSGVGKVKFDEFSIKKNVDTSSPLLYQACATGAHFPTVYLAMRKAGGAPLIYLEYIFRMVYVTGISWSGGGGEELPSEEVKFKFGAMGMQYQAQDATGAATKSPGTLYGIWSVTANNTTLTCPPTLTDTPEFDQPGASLPT